MQVHRFETSGGYVAHKVRLPSYSPMTFSLWFTAQGKLIDAEAYDSLRRPHAIPAKLVKVLEARFPLIETAYRVMQHMEGF